MIRIDEIRNSYEEHGFLVVKSSRSNGFEFLYLEIYSNEEMLRKGQYLTSLQFNKEGTQLLFVGLSIDYNDIIYVPV